MHQNLTGPKSEITVDYSSLLTSFSNSLKPSLYCLTQAPMLKNQHILFLSSLAGHFIYENVRFKSQKDQFQSFLQLNVPCDPAI
jgi:hypothetical protein